MTPEQWQQVKEDIRLRLDIVTVVERYVSLRQTGSNYKGLCPFHKEKSPSFTVNPERGIYHCFGCGKGGDIFSFLMEYESLSFMEVLQQTAKEVGIKLEEPRKTSGYTGPVVQRGELYNANEVALRYFYQSMRESPEAVAYFQGRGLAAETVRDFRLGFAPDCWNGLIDMAHSHGISDQALLAAGLTVTSAKGGKAYDRFRGRIIFPIFDMAGRPVAFGGRTMDPDGQPKYLNSPETPLYQKNKVFYGLNIAREAFRSKKSAIIVEGYMDLLALHEVGISNVVATCGTALTSEHGTYLRRLVDEVILLFDGDSAGIQAARRAVETLFPLELSIKVVILPTGEDPDTMIKKNGVEALQKQIDEAQLGLYFYVDLLETNMDQTTPQGKAKVAEQMAQLIASVKSDFMCDAYLNMFGASSASYKIDELSLRKKVQRLRKLGIANSTSPVQQDRRIEKLISTEEGSVIHILVSNPVLIKTWSSKIPFDFFTTPQFAKLYSLICSYSNDVAKVLDDSTLSPELKQLMTILLLEPFEGQDVESMLAHKVAKLSQSVLERKKSIITGKLSSTTDSAKKLELLAELQQLTSNSTTGE